MALFYAKRRDKDVSQRCLILNQTTLFRDEIIYRLFPCQFLASSLPHLQHSLTLFSQTKLDTRRIENRQSRYNLYFSSPSTSTVGCSLSVSLLVGGGFTQKLRQMH